MSIENALEIKNSFESNKKISTEGLQEYSLKIAKITCLFLQKSKPQDR